MTMRIIPSYRLNTLVKVVAIKYGEYLMNRDELTAIIRNAKISHKRWVENALSLIEGVALDKSQVPVNATDCIFGKWYYNEGQALKSISIFREIESHHDTLHQLYREIFVLLFSEEHTKPSLLSRLFGSSAKLDKEKKQHAHDKFQLLEQQSKAIIKKLDDLEAIINAMPAEQLTKYSL